MKSNTHVNMQAEYIGCKILTVVEDYDCTRSVKEQYMSGNTEAWEKIIWTLENSKGADKVVQTDPNGLIHLLDTMIRKISAVEYKEAVLFEF